MNWRAIGGQTPKLVEGLSRREVQADISRMLCERVLRSSTAQQ
jgi:hypothetical protein